MAVQTRPYFLVLNGEQHMVEAAGPAGAVRHVIGAAVTELRPARGAEVAAWTRAGKPIPIAGQKPADLPAAPALPERESVAEEPAFHPDDAVQWLIDHGATERGLTVFGRIRSEKRMTLEHFDELRMDCPDFGVAIVEAVTGSSPVPEGDVLHPGYADEIRGELEERPFTRDVVVGAIAEAKRRDLFVDRDAPAA